MRGIYDGVENHYIIIIGFGFGSGPRPGLGPIRAIWIGFGSYILEVRQSWFGSKYKQHQSGLHLDPEKTRAIYIATYNFI